MTARKFKYPVSAMLVSEVIAGKNMEANLSDFEKGNAIDQLRNDTSVQEIA